MNTRFSNYNSKVLAVAFVVTLITILVYLPALQNDFVNWDDDDYVYKNPNIRYLDSKSIKWMFTAFHESNWHPLTWFSHAVDYAIWGLNPAGHHQTNIILHGLNTFLVVLLIVRLLEITKKLKTNRDGKEGMLSDKAVIIAAGITGLLFGLHPVHVESVAWISERKDVLCAFFYLLSLITYVHYVKEAGMVNGKGRPLALFLNRHYRWSLVLFILSLMSKPMAVTLPVVLIILDWYPFRRFKQGSLSSVLMEKLPFLFLSLGSAVITILAQRLGGAIKSFTVIPLSTRILVGLRSIVDYLYKMVYPVDLSPYYPHPQVNQSVTLLSYKYLIPLILIIGITITCVIFLRRQKLWSAVWGCYLVTLLPVLGIIQVGSQAMADRYTYLPSIGPFLLIGLGAAWIADKRLATGQLDTVKKLLSFFVVTLLLGALSYATIRQTRIWESTETLWNKVIAIYPGISLPYNNRGVYYREAGQYEKAISDFTRGISITPDNFLLYANRARAYAKLGRFEDALDDAGEAIRLNPGNWKTHLVRAKVYAMFARNREALNDYTEVLKLNSGLPEVYNNRGNIYVKLGLLEEAVSDYRQAINLSPTPRAAYYYNLAITYKMLEQPERALENLMQYKNIRDNP